MILSATNPLDNYIIEQAIGKGTFGKVYQGLHKPTRQNVAIKILEKSRIENDADFTRIQREIHILRKIRHPNIIQLFEILESESKIYLIMEYVSGGELFQKIVKQRKLHEQEAAQLYVQIIEAIEYLHTLRIAHRDLKPENLLLTENNKIKVVDFGLSNLYTDMLSTPCGSPCYAAPEMVSGQPYHGLKTDIWASGVILYAMVCGCVPFEDPNTRKLYEKIKHSDYIRPQHLSPIICDLLNGLLQKNPQKRLPISSIKMHPFIQCFTYQNPITQKTLQVNFQILQFMQQNGIDSQKCKEMLMNNKHNAITTTYYLLVQEQERKQKKRVKSHQSIKSVVDKPLSTERRQVSNTYHSKTKSSEHQQSVMIPRQCDSINRRTFTESDQIKIKNYLRERNKTQYSNDYSTFRKSITARMKENTNSGQKNTNSSQKNYNKNMSGQKNKSPIIYAEFKLKTARII